MPSPTPEVLFLPLSGDVECTDREQPRTADERRGDPRGSRFGDSRV